MCFLAMRLGYLSEAETAASVKLITEQQDAHQTPQPAFSTPNP